MSGGMIKTDTSGLADIVLTTKGDLATWDTERVRKGVSATNYTGLQADSAIADGLTYGATARSTLAGTGSLLYSSGANTLAQLSAGTGEYTLKMNSGGTAPEWVDVSAGATVTVQSDIMTSDETTTSGTFSDTALALTCQSSGKFFATTSLNWAISVDTACFFRFTDGTTDIQRMQGDQSTFGGRLNIAISDTGTSASQVVNIEIKTSGGTLTLYGQNDQATSRLDMMEVS